MKRVGVIAGSLALLGIPLTLAGTAAQAAVTSNDQPKKVGMCYQGYFDPHCLPSNLPTPKPSPTPTVTPVSYGQCPQPGGYSQGSCAFGVNQTQFFTSADQLAPKAYQAYKVKTKEGCLNTSNPQPFPATFPATGFFAEYLNCGNLNIKAYGEYSPAAPLPGSDTVTMNLYNGQDAGGLDPSSSCTSGTYTGCTLTHEEGRVTLAESQFYNSVFQIQTYPVTVAVYNNLPAANNDSLVLEGTPAVNRFVLDPKGGLDSNGNDTSKTIQTGQVGYFGVYGVLPTTTPAPNNPPSNSPTPGFGTLESLSATYRVSPQSTDLSGASFSLNAVINPATGDLDSSATCTYNQGSQVSTTPTCSLHLQGFPGGPQTIVVNIHE